MVMKRPAAGLAASGACAGRSLPRRDRKEAKRGFAMRFRGIMRSGDIDKLTTWIDDVLHSGIYSMQRFGRSLRQDLDAVRNAVTEPWSNGQVEGQINRLKTLKRAMYGRAGVELLRARMLPLQQPSSHTV